MKKILILLILPMATLTGCASYNKSKISDSYVCRKILHQMYAAPHRYKEIGRNKRLATIEAKLQKDYRHYDCSRYDD